MTEFAKVAVALEAENIKLRSALTDIMNWIENSDGDEQIPPRYIDNAHDALQQPE